MKICVQSANALKRACDQCGNTPETLHSALLKKGQFCEKCCGCSDDAGTKVNPGVPVPAKRQAPRDPFYRDERRKLGSNYLKPGGASDWLRGNRY